VVASFIHGWLDFLDGQKHPSPTAGSYALWVVVVLIGFALPVLAYVRDQDGALHVSAFAGVWLRRLTYTTSSSFERFIVAPVAEIVVRFGERWIPVGDGEVGVALDTTGRLMASGARLPVLPLVVLLAVILTVVVGLVAPGVFR
jgi:hypothetical protein